jgi:hypothetical protein
VRSVNLLSIIAFVLVSCAHPGPSTKKQVKAEGEVTIKPGIKLVDLAPVAVASFGIIGLVKHKNAEGKEEVLRQEHPDTMRVTDGVIKMLLQAGVTMVDRQQIDKRMKELAYSASDLVNDETARTFGEQIGAKTLITGFYEFNCEGDLTRTKLVNAKRDSNVEDHLFVKPSRVFSQSISIKAFNVETGEVIFMIEQRLGESSDVTGLYPRPLSQLAAKKLIAALNSNTKGSSP